MATIRIIGGTGFVGQNLVQLLIAVGYSLRLLVRQPVASIEPNIVQITGSLGTAKTGCAGAVVTSKHIGRAIAALVLVSLVPGSNGNAVRRKCLRFKPTVPAIRFNTASIYSCQPELPEILTIDIRKGL